MRLEEVWPRIAIQRCTAHKLRNLEGKARVRTREELKEDYQRMIYAETVSAVEQARVRFLKKWRLACPPVTASLEEAGEELFTFLEFPKSQWKALRTTNALKLINEVSRRRTKTQALRDLSHKGVDTSWGLNAADETKVRGPNLPRVCSSAKELKEEGHPCPPNLAEKDEPGF